MYSILYSLSILLHICSLKASTDDESDGESNRNEILPLVGQDYYRVDSDTSDTNHNSYVSNRWETVDGIGLLNGPKENVETSSDNEDSEVLITNEHSLQNKKRDDYNKLNNNDDPLVYKAEIKAGNIAELFGSNPHYNQPDKYPELNRRFVPQYPYKDISNELVDENKENKLVPKLAPPELVLEIAKKSKLLQDVQAENPADEYIKDNILRSGNYWNAVWKEEVDPKMVLRTETSKSLGIIETKIMPGSSLYKLVANLQKMSPKLLYVINKKNT